MTNKWMWPLLLLTLLSLACDNKKTTVYEYGGQLGAASSPVTVTPSDPKNKKPEIGAIIDRFNGVAVYYNGGNLHNTDGRNVTSDGYNLGLKWQCVEFVKRYYYLQFEHRMPDPWGHAINFFKKGIPDGGYNAARNLRQFTNPSKEKPRVNDIIVFGAVEGNPFGHVAIVSRVGANYVEIVQQNVGTQSRYTLPLFDMVGSWRIANIDVMGWLGKRSE